MRFILLLLVWKPFSNVLDKQKIVLKTHLFSKIFRFLYRGLASLIKSKETSNKNQHSNLYKLTKMTKKLKFWNPQRHILLKRIDWKLYVKLSPFRSSPPHLFSKKDDPQTLSKPTGEQQRRSAISTKPLCNFLKITPTHSYAPEISQHICRTPSSGRTPLGDCFCMSKDF